MRQTFALVLTRFGAVLDKIEVTLASLFVVAAVVITLYGMFYRDIGGSTGAWVPQSVQYLVIWAVFMASGAALRRNVHIRVFLLVNRLPRKASYVIEIIVHVVGIAACVAVAVWGIQTVMLLQSTHDRLYDFFNMPTYLFIISIPLGMALLAYHFAERLFQLLFAPSLVIPHPDSAQAAPK